MKSFWNVLTQETRIRQKCLYGESTKMLLFLKLILSQEMLEEKFGVF